MEGARTFARSIVQKRLAKELKERTIGQIEGRRRWWWWWWWW